MNILNRLNYKVYNDLEKISQKIHEGFVNNIKETKTKAVINRVGSMLTLFFTDNDRVENFDHALKCDTDKYAMYFKMMLDMGIYLPPSQYECCFFSTVLSDLDINKIIESNRIALKNLK